RWGERPMPFACAVALSGRFGFDLDLAGLSTEERSTCVAALALARRTQDLVQQGRLVRLVSPVEGADRSRAAWAHVSPQRDRAVVFGYQLDDSDQPGPSLRLDCFDDAA